MLMYLVYDKQGRDISIVGEISQSRKTESNLNAKLSLILNMFIVFLRVYELFFHWKQNILGLNSPTLSIAPFQSGF